MTLDPRRRDTLLKTLRGPDFRRALKAIAELRIGAGPESAALVASYPARDEQRAVQYAIARLVLERGVQGLVDAWPTPADAKWRAQLVSEIGQFLQLWTEEAIVDLVLAALEDRDRDVRVKAVWVLLDILRAESARGAGILKTVCGFVTPTRRARATTQIVRMLEEHRETPYPVLPQLVESLGYTATRNDRAAVEALEVLRDRSGEPYHVSYEKLDESKLSWPERLVAARKGIAPENVKLRIAYRGTGLLDQKLLNAALQRIHGRG